MYKTIAGSFNRNVSKKEMECFLVCRWETHDPIFLPDKKPIVVGRSAATKITEKKLSRNHVELTADYERANVVVKQLGVNPSTIAGTNLSQNQTGTLEDKGVLNLLANKYEHLICFKKQTISAKQDQLKNVKASEEIHQKRKYEPLEEENVAAKRQKTKEHEKPNCVSKNTNINLTNKEFCKSVIGEVKNEDGSEIISLAKEKFIPLGTSQWDEIESGKLLVYKREGLLPREKVASFDLDGTLVATKSGRVFATGLEDWKIKYSQVIQKIQTLQNDGYKIVVFTNQGSIGRGKLKKDDFKIKMENIAFKLNIPLQVFVATGYGIYRKPMKGMWQYLIEKTNCGLAIDKTKSFYVGDAAGRPANWAPKQKKDFAFSDRTFAENIGIRFSTPEEFFLDAKPATFSWPEFDPHKLNTAGPLFTPTTSKLVSDNQEVIVMVGFPAAGKTFFVKKHLLPQGYVHVNRDTCGSWQKCVAMCKTELSQRKSVVIDNTSPDKESRQRYIWSAKKANVPVRCMVLNVTYEHALHNNRIREIATTDKNYKSVGKMVFNTYRSSYQEPTISEGFTEILKVNFIADFKSTEFRDLYMQYTE